MRTTVTATVRSCFAVNLRMHSMHSENNKKLTAAEDRPAHENVSGDKMVDAFSFNEAGPSRAIIMRPSSVGGPHIALHSVCLSVCPVLAYLQKSVTCFRPTLRTCGIFCFVYICGPHTVGRSAAQACYYYYTLHCRITLS